MVEVGETAICALCGQSEVHSQAMQDFTFELYPDLIIAPDKAEYCCTRCTKSILYLGFHVYVKVIRSSPVHRRLLETTLTSVFGIELKTKTANAVPGAQEPTSETK